MPGMWASARFRTFPLLAFALEGSYSTWVTLLPVSLLVGGRPHIRAPSTVEKITSRDRRDSRHIHALTLELLHDIDYKGLMDDIRRSSMLTPRSSMDNGILLQDFLVFLYFYSYGYVTRRYKPYTLAVRSSSPSLAMYERHGFLHDAAWHFHANRIIEKLGLQ